MDTGQYRTIRVPAPTVRAVVFDVDGTLYHQSRLRACMATELAMSPLMLRSVRSSARLLRVLRTYRRVHEEMRSLTPDDAALASYQIQQTAYRERMAEREVQDIVAEWMQDRPLKYLRWCRRRGLIALLSLLHEHGTYLGVLSDYPARAKLTSLGIDEFFSQILCTTDREINALKPHPRGFLRACELWNLAPGEVLYVGDRSDVDARGALAAGVRCAVFTRRAPSLDISGAPEPIQIRRCLDISALVYSA